MPRPKKAKAAKKTVRRPKTSAAPPPVDTDSETAPTEAVEPQPGPEPVPASPPAPAEPGSDEPGSSLNNRCNSVIISCYTFTHKEEP